MESHLLFHELNQAVRFFTKEWNDRLQNYDLYSSQWTILYCLKRYGSMTQTEIWRYLNVEAPTVTRTINRLEQNGWVVREFGSDRRERIVSLSDKANDHLPEIEKANQSFEQEVLKPFTEEEQETLLYLLKKLRSGHLSIKGDIKE